MQGITAEMEDSERLRVATSESDVGEGVPLHSPRIFEYSFLQIWIFWHAWGEMWLVAFPAPVSYGVKTPGLAVTRETRKSSNHFQSISGFLPPVPLPARAEHDAVELLQRCLRSHKAMGWDGQLSKNNALLQSSQRRLVQTPLHDQTLGTHTLHTV